jgi:hypothetical protein
LGLSAGKSGDGIWCRETFLVLPQPCFWRRPHEGPKGIVQDSGGIDSESGVKFLGPRNFIRRFDEALAEPLSLLDGGA